MAERKPAAAKRGTGKAKAKAKPKARSRSSGARKRAAEEKREEARRAGELDLAADGLVERPSDGSMGTLERAQTYIGVYKDWLGGMDYMGLAETHKLSKRRCEQIVQDLRGRDLAAKAMEDPLFGLREMQDMLLIKRASISEYVMLARQTQSENIKLGALRDRDRAITEYVTLLQEMGLVPKHLGTLRIQEDFIALIDALLDGLDEEGIAPDVQRRLVERVELRTTERRGKVQLAIGGLGVIDGEETAVAA